MTDDELESELRRTLQGVASAYEPSAGPRTTSFSARRRSPQILAVAAVLVALAALAAVLLTGNDDVADLDIRDNTTSTPTAPDSTTSAPASTTSSPAAPATGELPPLSEWRWSTGATAPIEARRGHEGLWVGSELAIWGGEDATGPLSTAAAYDPVADSWREISGVEVSAAELLRDDPGRRVSAGIELPVGVEVLGGIVQGRFESVADPETRRSTPTLTGDSGATVVLPDLPVDGPWAFGLRDAIAVWTGAELVVWGGEWTCPPNANCVWAGPRSALVLRPPDPAPTFDLPIAGQGVSFDLADLLGTTWVLYSIEVDGRLLPDDESGTIAFEIAAQGPEPFPLPLTLAGWAGCDFSVGGASDTDGQIGWHADTAPTACEGSTSTLASTFRDRLADTRRSSMLDLWPTDFLELAGDGIRMLFVPATDRTVVGPAPAAPATTTTIAAPSPPTAPADPAATWPLTDAPYGPLANEFTVSTDDEFLTFGQEHGAFGPTFGPDDWVVVGYGYHPELDRYRLIEPLTMFPTNQLDHVVRIGDRVLVYADAGGVSELLAYDPKTDTWSPIAAADFASSVPVWDIREEAGRLHLFTRQPERTGMLIVIDIGGFGYLSERVRLAEPWPDPTTAHDASLDELWVFARHLADPLRAATGETGLRLTLDETARRLIVTLPADTWAPDDPRLPATLAAIETVLAPELAARSITQPAGDLYSVVVA